MFRPPLWRGFANFFFIKYKSTKQTFPATAPLSNYTNINRIFCKLFNSKLFYHFLYLVYRFLLLAISFFGFYHLPDSGEKKRRFPVGKRLNCYTFTRYKSKCSMY